MAAPLSETQLATLCSICDTFFPACAAPSRSSKSTKAFYNNSLGENLEYMRALHTSILALDAPKIFETKALLTAIGSTAGSLALFSSMKPFPSLSLEEREARIKGLGSSSIETKRKVFIGLKRLIMGLAMSYVSPEGHNEYWESVQYEGPPSNDSKKEREHIEKISST